MGESSSEVFDGSPKNRPKRWDSKAPLGQHILPRDQQRRLRRLEVGISLERALNQIAKWPGVKQCPPLSRNVAPLNEALHSSPPETLPYCWWSKLERAYNRSHPAQQAS